MKRIALILAVVLLISCLTACNAPSDNNESSEMYSPALMTAEKKAELEHFLTMNVDDWYSEKNLEARFRYYGTYDGYDIIFIESLHNFTHRSQARLIANITFLHIQPFSLCAYKDGNSIDLKEAYNQGLVSKETIEKVAELHQHCYEKIFPDEE